MSKKAILDEIERMQLFLKRNCNVEEVSGKKLTNIQKMNQVYKKLRSYVSELPEDSIEINGAGEGDFLKRIAVLNEHTELIIAKHMEDEEFSYDDYELKPSFSRLADNLYTSVPSEFAEMRRVNITEPITFEGEYSLDKVCNMNMDVVDDCCWSNPNSFLARHYSESQKNRMASALSTYFTKNAGGTRHGALPFMVFALMEKGYSPEDILADKVKEEDYEDLYNHIIAMKPENSEKQAGNDENLNIGAENEQSSKILKSEQAVEWANEIFVRGAHKAYKELEERVSFNHRQFPAAFLNPATTMLGIMVMIGSTNYMQNDEEALARIHAMEDRLSLPFKGHDFHVTDAYTDNYNTFVSYSPDNYRLFLQCYSQPRLAEFSTVETAKSFIRLMADMQTEYTTHTAYYRACQQENGDIENGEEFIKWFNKNGEDPVFFAFLNDSLKKPSTLTEMHVNPETGRLVVDVDMEKVKADYAKYVKAHKKEAESDYQINKVEGTLNRAIKNDTAAMTITPKGLEEVYELHKQKPALTNEIYSHYKNRLDEIVSSLKGIEEKPGMWNKENYDKIKKIGQDLREFTTNTVEIPKAKFRLLLSDVGQLTESSEDTMEYKGKFEHVVKDVLSKANDIGKKLPKTEKVEDISKEEVADKVHSLYNITTNMDLKKAENPPKLTNTVEAIKSIYGEALEQLKNTCEFDKETGRPTGNTKYFDSMYDSIEAVAKYNPGNSGPSLNELLERARIDVCTYRDKRDSFIKWTTKGRVRLDFSKDMADICIQVSDKYDTLTLKATETRAKNSKALAEKLDLTSELTKSTKAKKSSGKSKNMTMDMDVVPKGKN